jgi:hypothetical protein
MCRRVGQALPDNKHRSTDMWGKFHVMCSNALSGTGRLTDDSSFSFLGTLIAANQL